jgi:hypothetical protein
MMLEVWDDSYMDIDLLVADDSTKHALGRINDVMIELHMTFVMILPIAPTMRRSSPCLAPGSSR